MCGIVGYVGPRDAAPILLEGLRRLEYRGYDSAGIAVLTGDGEVFIEKKAGKLTNLTDHLNGDAPAGQPGIGAHPLGDPRPAERHERAPAHRLLRPAGADPQRDHRELRRDQGPARWRRAIGSRSETDTEVLAHLIETKYAGDLVDAVRAALNEVRGAYAIGVMHTEHPDRIVGARMNVPLIVGIGDGEGFLASDVPAILEHTKNVVILHEGDVADVTPDGTRISSLDGVEVRARRHRDPLEPRRGREGRLRALHAQGDLRAAARHPGVPPRPCRRRRRRPAERARRASRIACARSSGSTSSAAARPATRRTWPPT